MSNVLQQHLPPFHSLMPPKKAATKISSESRHVTRTTTTGSNDDETTYQTAGESPLPETLPTNGNHADSPISTMRGEKRMRPSGQYVDSSDLQNPAKKQKGAQEAPTMPSRPPSFNNIYSAPKVPRKRVVGIDIYNFPSDNDEEMRPKTQHKLKSGTQTKAQVEPIVKRGQGRPRKKRPKSPDVETQEVIKLVPDTIPDDIAHNVNGGSVSEGKPEPQHHESEHEEDESDSEPPRKGTRKNTRAYNKTNVSYDERYMDGILTQATAMQKKVRKDFVDNPPMVEKEAKPSAAKASTQIERESEIQDIVDNDAMSKGHLKSNDDDDDEEEEEEEEEEEKGGEKERDEPYLPAEPPLFNFNEDNDEDSEYEDESGGEGEDENEEEEGEEEVGEEEVGEEMGEEMDEEVGEEMGEVGEEVGEGEGEEEGEEESEGETGVSSVLKSPTPVPEKAQPPAADPKLVRKEPTARGQEREVADSTDDYVLPVKQKSQAARHAPSNTASRKSYIAAAQFHAQLEDEGASDFSDDFADLPHPFPLLYQKLLDSSEGLQTYRKGVDVLSNLQCKLRKLQYDNDEDENRGFFYILDDLLSALREGKCTKEDQDILLPQLDKVLGYIRELQQTDVQIEAEHRRLVNRHAKRASNHRKCVDAIRIAFKRAGYKSANAWLTDKEAKEKRRMGIAERWNKRISDQLDQRIAEMEREERQRREKYRSTTSSARNTISTGRTSTSSRHRRASSNDYDDWAVDLPPDNYDRRPIVGNAEVVTIEGFGERGRRPRPSTRVSYEEDPDVLEDRPWGDKETECLIIGLENYTGSGRFKRIKNHWAAFFKYRSEADLRNRALDIRGNLIDADIQLADWWAEI
ncbi:hypothetical protein BDD12DRAFT_90412 [Trichophaea hybrida]|nr:hypothetical protein BDD12DRAFT_90412 [Trichophaea hybrida]